ncbi:hypothetical protein BH09BAC3_BH09BAC3_37180 [soil metagenome]
MRILFLFITISGVFLGFATRSFSQSTVGPNNPSTAADGGGGSGGVPNWNVAPGTPFSSDGTYATIVSMNKSKNTNYLHVSGFGFSIPVGSYVSGIKVEVEMFGTVPGAAINKENSILLLNASGSRVGTDRNTSATLATADPNSYVTYGGSTDNWGGALTYADINSPNFGVALQYQSGGVNNTAGNYNYNVDHVRVTITYAPGYDAVINGCFNDGATWGRVSPGVAGIDYPNATIAANIPGGRTVTVCSGTIANCFALVMNSDLSTNSGATLTIADATASLNVAGDILMLTTTSASASFASGTINISGGIITAQGNLQVTADRSPPNATSQSIVFSGGTMTVNGDLIMSSDNAAATSNLNMTTANSVLNVGGDLSLGVGASLTNGAGATGTINYKGTGAQIIRSAITYFNLTYSGGGLKSLEAATNVKGTFNMISGDCDMAAQLLTLGSSTASKGTLSYTSGSLYNGTFRRWFDNATTIVDGNIGGLFPVGSPVGYRPFYVYWGTAPTTGGTLSVTHDYFTSGVSVVSFLDGASTVVRRTNMFWTLTAANGFNIAVNRLNVRIDPANVGSVGITSLNTVDLRVTLAGSVIGTAGVNAGTPAVPIVRRVNLPAFTGATNNFYIGSVDATNSPLPIELQDFQARVTGSTVNVTWRTASEVNNNFFTVERSADGEGFKAVGEVPGNGTTVSPHSYTLVDPLPLEGKSYYRLRQTDYDGKSTLSKIVVVEYDANVSPRMVLHPNPSDGNELNLRLEGVTSGSEVPIIVYDLMGRTYQRYQMTTDGNERKIIFDNSLPPGMYVLKAGSSDGYAVKFVVFNR